MRDIRFIHRVSHDPGAFVRQAHAVGTRDDLFDAFTDIYVKVEALRIYRRELVSVLHRIHQRATAEQDG